MKNRFFVIFLIIGLFFISSCQVVEEHNEEIELKYTEDDLEKVSVVVNSLDVTLDLSNNHYLKNLLLSVKLCKNISNTKLNIRTSKYVIYFGDYEFTIYDNKTICYINNETEIDYLTASNNDFDYLDTLFDSNILDFSKYTDLQTIKVSNSKNDSAEITDKSNFLDNLNQIKYLKLNNVDHYQLTELKYQISIDEEIIKVYDGYITINEDSFIIIEGNFSFLNNIKFSSSSGWLPWI